ncbi:MAG: hypothetical protein K940chlam3_01043 [Chlamydiae bacterium]|nr:hypothetical protein [Chlamydiota bacterium]
MDTKKLDDDQLINEGFSKNPRPFILWFFILALLILGILSLQWSLKEYLEEKICESPFHRVTNREMSLFLWQNPEFMRAHVAKKSGYLPNFQYLDKVSVEPQFADDFVVAPPEILFLYHTWNRQVGDLYIPRPINPAEFQEFLAYAEEWQPQYWDEAMGNYIQLVENLSSNESDLNEHLPLEVKQAFQGWKNYTQEGDQIQNIQPTYEQMRRFLKKYPTYARNYWKNVVSVKYLQTLEDGNPQDIIPKVELSAFLKVAFFNDQMSLKNQ